MGGFVRKKKKKLLKIIDKFIKPKEAEVPKEVETKVAEVQKEAANKIQGPTTIEMADNTLLANKRKGRKITNKTDKKKLTEDYKLSKKVLLA